MGDNPSVCRDVLVVCAVDQSPRDFLRRRVGGLWGKETMHDDAVRPVAQGVLRPLLSGNGVASAYRISTPSLGSVLSVRGCLEPQMWQGGTRLSTRLTNGSPRKQTRQAFSNQPLTFVRGVLLRTSLGPVATIDHTGDGSAALRLSLTYFSLNLTKAVPARRRASGVSTPPSPRR